MLEKTFVLKPVKTTPGTFVYGQIDIARGDAVFPALYLPKSLFTNGPTPTVEVTLRIPS